MKFGICVLNYGQNCSKRSIDLIANYAEKLEYDSIWTTDHIIVTVKEAKIFGNLYETLTTLAYLSSKTENILLGTSIVILPLREPYLFAKQIATIDELSDGRLILGIGVGWLKEEFNILNKDFNKRGEIANENIKLIREIWSKNILRYKINNKLIDFFFGPNPKQKYGPKIFIGGNSRRAIIRAAKLGDGWHPVGLSPEQIEKKASFLRRISRERKYIFLRITVSPYSKKFTYKTPQGEIRYSLSGTFKEITENIEKYKKAGVDKIVGYFGDVKPEIYIERMKKFKEIAKSF